MKNIGLKNVELYLKNAIGFIEECNGNFPADYFKVKYLAAISNTLIAIAYIKLLDLLYDEDAHLPY